MEEKEEDNNQLHLLRKRRRNASLTKLGSTRGFSNRVKLESVPAVYRWGMGGGGQSQLGPTKEHGYK